jgi:glycosyltransferase involved in cell wall biosynthesis
MKILYIAPLPPPLAGHSLVAQVLYEDLAKLHHVEVVDFNKQSFNDGIDSFQRVFEVLNVLKDVWTKKKGADVVYLTISESVAGNLKDLFIYLICYGQLSQMFIHLHGGTIKRELWDKYPLIHKINKFFIKKMAGVIISGQSHLSIFSDLVPKEKIHMAPNFALESLFISEAELDSKFSDLTPMGILYISNMIDKKGYNDLADAYFMLDKIYQDQIRIDFAGRFETMAQETAFRKKIEAKDGLNYHGMVDNQEKESLFSKAHIFCLPTSYLEGQPVSILEAYASGCVVLTTGQPGILDIFTPGINGFEIKMRSPESIKDVIQDILGQNLDLAKIALNNRITAGEKYRPTIYNSYLRGVIESVKSVS